MIPHLNLPTEANVHLIDHDGFVEGQTTTGRYYIDGLGIFTFRIINFRFNPHRKDADRRMAIQISHSEGSLLCCFRPGDRRRLEDPRELFFKQTFLTALLGVVGAADGAPCGNALPVSFLHAKALMHASGMKF